MSKFLLLLYFFNFSLYRSYTNLLNFYLTQVLSTYFTLEKSGPISTIFNPLYTGTNINSILKLVKRDLYLYYRQEFGEPPFISLKKIL